MLILNSVIAFQELETEKWEFNDQKDLYFFQASPSNSEKDFVRFGCEKNWCFFKSNEQSGDLSTFESCDYNWRMSEGEGL